MSDPEPDLPLDADSDVSPFDIASARAREPVWDILLAIAAGGALGGAARFGLNSLWPTSPGGFPWSTFVENVTGALLLGVLVVFLVDVWRPRRYVRPFLGVGLLGGLHHVLGIHVGSQGTARRRRGAAGPDLRVRHPGARPAGLLGRGDGCDGLGRPERKHQEEHMKLQGPAMRLTVFVGESDQWHHRPVYTEVVHRAHAAGLAGASVMRGIEGYGASSRIHTSRFLSLSDDLPVAIVIIDSEAKIEAFLPQLDELITEGLVILDPVRVIKYAGRAPEDKSR